MQRQDWRRKFCRAQAIFLFSWHFTFLFMTINPPYHPFFTKTKKGPLNRAALSVFNRLNEVY